MVLSFTVKVLPNHTPVTVPTDYYSLESTNLTCARSPCSCISDLFTILPSPPETINNDTRVAFWHFSSRFFGITSKLLPLSPAIGYYFTYIICTPSPPGHFLNGTALYLSSPHLFPKNSLADTFSSLHQYETLFLITSRQVLLNKNLPRCN